LSYEGVYDKFPFLVAGRDHKGRAFHSPTQQLADASEKLAFL